MSFEEGFDGVPHKRCGIFGCRNPVVPAAFVEAQVQFAALPDLTRVRVEVCEDHFYALSPSIQVSVQGDLG